MKKIEYDKYSIEYGIYHFKVPTPFERYNAKFIAEESTTFKTIINYNHKGFYEEIPAPGKNDWLMNHKEYGQTYLEYRNFGWHLIEEKKNIIYLAPLKFNLNKFFDDSFITALAIICQAYYHNMQVKVLEIDDLDLNGVEYREFDDGSFQMNANSLLDKLLLKKPDDAYCLICFTDCDLFNDRRIIKPRDWIYVEGPYNNNFCYELNSFKYWVSILSFHRFDPNFAAKVKVENEESQLKLNFILLKRFSKMVIKNVGHMFGCKNCIYHRCIMNGFNSMSEFDKRPMELCPVCLRKIFTNICLNKDKVIETKRVSNPFLILERYHKIIDCLKDNFCDLYEEEVNWYTKRLDCLEHEIFGKKENRESAKNDDPHFDEYYQEYISKYDDKNEDNKEDDNKVDEDEFMKKIEK